MTPIQCVREILCVTNGCLYYKCDCIECEQQAGGCEGHIWSDKFDEEVDKVISELDRYDEWTEKELDP